MRRAMSDIIGPGQQSQDFDSGLSSESRFVEPDIRRQSSSVDMLESYTVGCSTFYTTGPILAICAFHLLDSI